MDHLIWGVASLHFSNDFFAFIFGVKFHPLKALVFFVICVVSNSIQIHAFF
jgi:hypothetical protein